MILRIVLGIVAFILLVIVVFILIMLCYHSNAYPETREIADRMKKDHRDYWFCGDTGVGFIIFSGAEVKEEGYAYIAKLLHDEGHTVVIPHQRFQMSLFGTKHAVEIINQHTEVKKWILIGHSLGGMPVSRVAAQVPEHLIGIVYLASYASSELSGLDFPALRISADHDGVMNNERMDASAHNLPEGSKSVMLEGAIHRGFGGYLSRFSREKEAGLDWKEQNEISVRLTLEFYAERIAQVERDA